jgi:hypothetical protein
LSHIRCYEYQGNSAEDFFRAIQLSTNCLCHLKLITRKKEAESQNNFDKIVLIDFLDNQSFTQMYDQWDMDEEHEVVYTLEMKSARFHDVDLTEYSSYSQFFLKWDKISKMSGEARGLWENLLCCCEKRDKNRRRKKLTREILFLSSNSAGSFSISHSSR